MRLFCLIMPCLFLAACEKKEYSKPVSEPGVNSELKAGLPDNFNSVDGVFYYGFTKSNPYYSPSYWQVFYASFSDPKKNLITGFNGYFDYRTDNKYTGNIDVGEVSFNNTSLSKSSTGISFHYITSNYSSAFPETISWHSEGNRVFKNLEFNADSASPFITTPTPSITTIDKSAGVTINIAPFAYNYDSLIVLITESGSSYGNFSRKVVTKNQPVVFSPEDFQNFYFGTNNSTIYYCAFKYYYMIVNGKTYVFVHSYKIIHSVYLTP